MLKHSLLLLAAALGAQTLHADAQAPATATRLIDIQLGGGFTFARSDYVPNTIGGFAFYGDFDVLSRYGLEVDFHQVRDPNADPLVPSNHFSERTYEVGGRYLRHYFHDTVSPYGKVLYGRGVVNFPAHEVFLPNGALIYINNIAYNMAVFGAGVDYRVTRRVNLRADFEYQHWFGSDAELPNGLTPKLFTFGAAYHFPARPPRVLAP